MYSAWITVRNLCVFPVQSGGRICTKLRDVGWFGSFKFPERILEPVKFYLEGTWTIVCSRET